MNKILIFLIIFFIPSITFWNQNDLESIDVIVWTKQIKASNLQKWLDQVINKTTNNDLEKNLKIYYKTKIILQKYNKNNDLNQ